MTGVCCTATYGQFRSLSVDIFQNMKNHKSSISLHSNVTKLARHSLVSWSNSACTMIYIVNHHHCLFHLMFGQTFWHSVWIWLSFWVLSFWVSPIPMHWSFMQLKEGKFNSWLHKHKADSVCLPLQLTTVKSQEALLNAEQASTSELGTGWNLVFACVDGILPLLNLYTRITLFLRLPISLSNQYQLRLCGLH